MKGMGMMQPEHLSTKHGNPREFPGNHLLILSESGFSRRLLESNLQIQNVQFCLFRWIGVRENYVQETIVLPSVMRVSENVARKQFWEYLLLHGLKQQTRSSAIWPHDENMFLLCRWMIETTKEN
jgi:hypothetical protein